MDASNVGAVGGTFGAYGMISYGVVTNTSLYAEWGGYMTLS